ncbi:MAG: ATP-binding cassette domain-containing protein [Burkholderiaceae bacterium]|nr:ATP-binding cassette domain-containing protein [Burkholderiaceae bacterium]
MQGIVKRFGATTVLDGVDLDIGRQEFVCLLGPSGCGKTTLMRVLCGIENASAGSITLNGRNITALPPALRRFGVVFQSYALFPNLTALENVAYGLGTMERAHRLERAREMLDLVELGGLLDRFPAQLSGGQQQRVALARALAPQPQLLLLDEPLSALDAQVRHTLRAEIRRVQQRLRIPAVMVTHDQDEALAMADRVILMREGRIEQASTPTRLYARPASEFAARFVGRINLWPAEVLAPNEVLVGRTPILLDHHVPAGTRRVMLGIRPEQVRIESFDFTLARAPQATLPVDGHTGLVLEATFCGAYMSLRVEVPGLKSTVQVECRPPVDATLPWQPGDACTIRLPAAALHVIPA